jgi:hypothetical protein
MLLMLQYSTAQHSNINIPHPVNIPPFYSAVVFCKYTVQRKEILRGETGAWQVVSGTDISVRGENHCYKARFFCLKIKKNSDVFPQ